MKYRDTRTIIGIDPSSRKLAMVAQADGNRDIHIVSEALVPKDSRGGTPAACLRAYDLVGSFVLMLQTVYRTRNICAYLEAPIVGRGGARTTMVQSFVSGAIQASLQSHEIPVTLVYPGSWKKLVVGHGNATKETVSQHLRGVWPALMERAKRDQDVIDAACICLFGQHQTSEAK